MSHDFVTPTVASTRPRHPHSNPFPAQPTVYYPAGASVTIQKKSEGYGMPSQYEVHSQVLPLVMHQTPSGYVGQHTQLIQQPSHGSMDGTPQAAVSQQNYYQPDQQAYITPGVLQQHFQHAPFHPRLSHPPPPSNIPPMSYASMNPYQPQFVPATQGSMGVQPMLPIRQDSSGVPQPPRGMPAAGGAGAPVANYSYPPPPMQLGAAPIRTTLPQQMPSGPPPSQSHPRQPTSAVFYGNAMPSTAETAAAVHGQPQQQHPTYQHREKKPLLIEDPNTGKPVLGADTSGGTSRSSSARPDEPVGGSQQADMRTRRFSNTSQRSDAQSTADAATHAPQQQQQQQQHAPTQQAQQQPPPQQQQPQLQPTFTSMPPPTANGHPTTGTGVPPPDAHPKEDVRTEFFRQLHPSVPATPTTPGAPQQLPTVAAPQPQSQPQPPHPVVNTSQPPPAFPPRVTLPTEQSCEQSADINVSFVYDPLANDAVAKPPVSRQAESVQASVPAAVKQPAEPVVQVAEPAPAAPPPVSMAVPPPEQTPPAPEKAVAPPQPAETAAAPAAAVDVPDAAAVEPPVEAPVLTHVQSGPAKLAIEDIKQTDAGSQGGGDGSDALSGDEGDGEGSVKDDLREKIEKWEDELVELMLSSQAVEDQQRRTYSLALMRIIGDAASELDRPSLSMRAIAANDKLSTLLDHNQQPEHKLGSQKQFRSFQPSWHTVGAGGGGGAQHRPMASRNSGPGGQRKQYHGRGSARGGGPPPLSGRGSMDHQRVVHRADRNVDLRKADHAWKPGTNVPEGDDEDLVKLAKRARGLLNKLSPDNYPELQSEFLSIKVDKPLMGKRLVKIIFEKAVDEPAFCEMYSKLVLAKVNAELEIGKQSGHNKSPFRDLLLQQCQTVFQTTTDDRIQAKLKELENCSDEKRRKELQAELDEHAAKERRRTYGNIGFIGQLYERGLLTGPIVNHCFNHLLLRSGTTTNAVADEEAIDCLIKLLTLVGRNFESERASEKIKDGGRPHLKKLLDHVISVIRPKVQNRIKFAIDDLIDMQTNQWRPRRDKKGPTTIAEVHKQVQKEKIDADLEAKQAAYAGRNSRGGGRPPMSGGRPFYDGRSSVGNQSRNQPPLMNLQGRPSGRQYEREKLTNPPSLGKATSSTMTFGATRNLMSWAAGSGNAPMAQQQPGTPRGPMAPAPQLQQRTRYGGRSSASNVQAQSSSRPGSRENSMSRSGVVLDDRASALNAAASIAKGGLRPSRTATDVAGMAHAAEEYSRPPPEPPVAAAAPSAAAQAGSAKDSKFKFTWRVLKDEEVDKAMLDDIMAMSPADIENWMTDATRSMLALTGPAAIIVRHRVGRLIAAVHKQNCDKGDSALAGFCSIGTYAEEEGLEDDNPNLWKFLAEVVASALVASAAQSGQLNLSCFRKVYAESTPVHKFITATFDSLLSDSDSKLNTTAAERQALGATGQERCARVWRDSDMAALSELAPQLSPGDSEELHSKYLRTALAHPATPVDAVPPQQMHAQPGDSSQAAAAPAPAASSAPAPSDSGAVAAQPSAAANACETASEPQHERPSETGTPLSKRAMEEQRKAAMKAERKQQQQAAKAEKEANLVDDIFRSVDPYNWSGELSAKDEILQRMETAFPEESHAKLDRLRPDLARYLANSVWRQWHSQGKIPTAEENTDGNSAAGADTAAGVDLSDVFDEAHTTLLQRYAAGNPDCQLAVLHVFGSKCAEQYQSDRPTVPKSGSLVELVMRILMQLCHSHVIDEASILDWWRSVARQKHALWHNGRLKDYIKKVEQDCDDAPACLADSREGSADATPPPLTDAC